MRKGVLFFVFALIACISMLGYFWSGRPPEMQVAAPGNTPVRQLGLNAQAYRPVIDPGHGGVDGGAISITGVNESTINLNIGLKMAAFMRFLGVSPEMTRETDISRHDTSARSIADKKASDLRNRADFVNGIENAVLLSVHQNEFEQASVKGAEVYFNAHEKSKGLADLTQSLLISRLNPANRRGTRKIGANYLMNHVTGPAILTECGFISNPEEEAKLLSGSYQTKVAAVIAVAYFNWTEGIS